MKIQDRIIEQRLILPHHLQLKGYLQGAILAMMESNECIIKHHKDAPQFLLKSLPAKIMSNN